MLTFLLWALGGVSIVGSLYALHYFALHLERKGVLYYWHKRPESGPGSSMLGPLQQYAEPRIRHVMEIRDQLRRDDGANGDGDRNNDHSGDDRAAIRQRPPQVESVVFENSAPSGAGEWSVP